MQTLDVRDVDSLVLDGDHAATTGYREVPAAPALLDEGDATDVLV